MTVEPLALGPGDNVNRLYELMSTMHVRHVPIVDAEGELVGLVSHRDLLRHALKGNSDLPVSLEREILQRIRISEVMTTDVETAEPDEDIREAAQLMLDNKYGCLPVVDGNRLVGIITEADFVRYVSESLGRIAATPAGTSTASVQKARVPARGQSKGAKRRSSS